MHALAIAAVPRRPWGSPALSSSGSTLPSSRLTKKLATDWIPSSGCPAAARRSSPARNASITCSWRATLNSRVTLTLMPAASAVRDRRQPLERAGDLDHRVGPVHRLPEPFRLGDGPLGVVGQCRRHLERHQPVDPAGPLVERQEGVAGGPHVGDGQGLEDPGRGAALGRAAGGCRRRSGRCPRSPSRRSSGSRSSPSARLRRSAGPARPTSSGPG